MKFLILYQDWQRLLDQPSLESFFSDIQRDGFDLENNTYLIVAFSLRKRRRERQITPTIRCIEIPSGPAYQFVQVWFLAFMIRSFCNSFKPDILYTAFPFLGPAVTLLPKKIPLVCFVRAKTNESILAPGKTIVRRIASNLVLVYEHLAFQRSSLLLHNGKSMADYARSLGYRGILEYCPRPLMDFAFANSPKKPAIAKKLSKNTVILIVARLSPEKDIATAIKALRHLPEDYVLVVVGTGPEQEQLKRQAAAVPSRVFFEGFVAHKDVWQYYNIADVFVLPSKTDFEGTPNVLKEAMYKKVPCVATDIAGNRNIIDSTTGILFPVGDAFALAERILFCTNSKNEKAINKMTAVAYAGIMKEQKTIRSMDQLLLRSFKHYKKQRDEL